MENAPPPPHSAGSSRAGIEAVKFGYTRTPGGGRVPIEPGQTLLHYRILDKLGEGGITWVG